MRRWDLKGAARGDLRCGLPLPRRWPALHFPHASPSFADAEAGLEEIVVTARKVAENLQDVPLSIDVFTAKDMKNLGIAGMDDFLQKTPSISYVSTGPGTQLFVMRGVSDGSNPNLCQHRLDRLLRR